MKKLTVVFIIGMVLVIFWAGSSYALITFTDTTSFTQTGIIPPEDYSGHNSSWDIPSLSWGNNVRWLAGAGDYVTWIHHFSFVPPAEKVLNGDIALTLFDNDPADNRLWKLEFGLGWGEDYNWALLDEVDPGTYHFSVNAHYLEDGAYQVTLLSLVGDFGISSSDLAITYQPTPEPASITLLGLGLLGLLGIGRKKVKKA